MFCVFVNAIWSNFPPTWLERVSSFSFLAKHISLVGLKCSSLKPELNSRRWKETCKKFGFVCWKLRVAFESDNIKPFCFGKQCEWRVFLINSPLPLWKHTLRRGWKTKERWKGCSLLKAKSVCFRPNSRHSHSHKYCTTVYKNLSWKLLAHFFLRINWFLVNWLIKNGYKNIHNKKYNDLSNLN